MIQRLCPLPPYKGSKGNGTKNRQPVEPIEIMQKNLKGIKKEKQYADQVNTDNCQVCGRKIILDGENWQEDDEGIVYCLDCWDEKESCGCSD